MKRILLVLLVLIEVHCIMAQTTIVCNAEGELPRLLEEKELSCRMEYTY